MKSAIHSLLQILNSCMGSGWPRDSPHPWYVTFGTNMFKFHLLWAKSCGVISESVSA